MQYLLFYTMQSLEVGHAFEFVANIVKTDKTCLHILLIVIRYEHVMSISLVFLWSITFAYLFSQIVSLFWAAVSILFLDK